MKNFSPGYLLFFCLLLFALNKLSAQSYLGTSGGFEADVQVINNQAFPTGGQSGRWTKANNSQTIGLQSSIRRSGFSAMQVLNSSNTTLRRVYTPTFTATPGQKLVIQYYRLVSSVTNTQESLAEISRNGSNTSTYTQPAPSVPAPAGIWQKVVFSPDVVGTDFSSTTWAAIQHRRTGTGSELYIDDVAVYTGSGEDNTAPNPVTGVNIANNSSNPATDMNLNWSIPVGGVDGGGYLVVRFDTNPNADNDPNVNGIYAQSTTYTNGTGGITGTVIYVGNSTSIVNTGLSYGTQYWYKVYTFDKAYNYSGEVVVTATTAGKTYYSKASGNLNVLATWGMNPDGSGTQPVSFSESYQLFNVVNNPTPTLNGNLSISLTGSRIIVGDGMAPVNLTIPGIYRLNGIIEVRKAGTLTNAHPQALFLTNLDPESTVHYNAVGATEQNIAAVNYGNLILSGASVKLPAADFSVLGNLTITSSAVLQADGYVFGIFGNWYVDGDGNYEPGSDIRSSINFRGPGSHTIYAQGGERFMNMKIFENGTVRLLSDVVVDSTLSLPEGKLFIAAHTLTLNGRFSGTPGNALSGSKKSNLVVGAGYTSGIIYLDQSVDSSNYLNSIINNSLIDTLTLGNKVKIAPHTLTDGKSGLVKVGTGSTLEIIDSLVLISDATGTARIGVSSPSGNYIVGKTTVQRYLPAKKAWHLLTAPVISSNITVNSAWMEDHTFPTIPATMEPSGYGTHITGGTNNYPDAASAEAVGFDYSAVQGPEASIRVFEGGAWNSSLPDGPSATLFPDYPAYLLYVRGDRKINLNNTNAAPTATTLRATGLIETGNNSPMSIATPFTLVGNPYPSPLDFEKIYSHTAGIQNKFWKWDARIARNGGHTLVQRTGANAYITVPADLDATHPDAQHIPSGYGFFVRPVSGPVNVSLLENDKSDSINTNTITGSLNPNLYVSLYKAGATDSIADGVLATFGNGQAGIDGEDAPKPENFEENLALRRSAQNLMLEARPAITTKDTLFLHFTKKAEQAYSFKIKGSQFANTSTAFLIDSFLHTSTPIELGGAITTYNFNITAVPDSKKDDRFLIVFQYNPPLPVTLTSLKAFSKNSDIAVEWNVSNESSIIRYEVEKSTDGVRFTKASATKALNASNGMAQYNWLDIAPVRGSNYYRIKTIALNGETTYSTIVRVSLSGGGKTGIVLYPNPVRANTAVLQFTNLQKGVYSAVLFNQAGQQALSRIVSHPGGTASQTIDLGNLATGMYQLQLIASDGSKTTVRFSKN